MTYDFQDGSGPVPAHQHPNGGGWVADTALVDATAYVEDTARVYGSAQVFGDAQVSGKAQVFGEARVSGRARVFGDAQVSGRAQVFGSAIVARFFSVNRSDGFTLGIYRDKEGVTHITAGCRDFSPEEAREHWAKTRGGTLLGAESLAAVDYLVAVFAAYEAEEPRA